MFWAFWGIFVTNILQYIQNKNGSGSHEWIHFVRIYSLNSNIYYNYG